MEDLILIVLVLFLDLAECVAYLSLNLKICKFFYFNLIEFDEDI